MKRSILVEFGKKLSLKRLDISKEGKIDSGYYATPLKSVNIRILISRT